MDKRIEILKKKREKIKIANIKADNEINEIMNLNDNSQIYLKLLNSENDKFKICNLDNLKTEYQKSNILLTVNDELLRYKNINKIKNKDYIIKVLNSITNDSIIEYYLIDNLKKINDIDLKKRIILCMKKEENRKKYLNLLDNITKLEVIKTFSDKTIITFFDEYIANETNIFLILKNEDYIYSFFDYYNDALIEEEKKLSNDDIDFDDDEYIDEYDDSIPVIEQLKLSVVDRLNEGPKKNKFISEFEEKTYNRYLENNQKNNRLLKKYNVKNDIQIDENIKFQLIFNLSNKNEEMHDDSELLNKWEFDCFDMKNPRLISKVFSFNNDSLKEILYMCNYLFKNNFKIDDERGLNICFDSSYFKDSNELNRYLNITSNCEDIFNILSNNNTINNVYEAYRKQKDILKILSIYNKKQLSFNVYKKIVMTTLEKNNFTFGSSEKGNLLYSLKLNEFDFKYIKSVLILLCRLLESVKTIDDTDSLYKNLITKTYNASELYDLLANLIFKNTQESNEFKKLFNNNINSYKIKSLYIPTKI